MQLCQDLSVEPGAGNNMKIDLSELVAVDPLEVIINPANPLEGFIKINDFIEEIEENIPQVEQNIPMEQNLIPGEQDVVQQIQAVPHVEGVSNATT